MEFRKIWVQLFRRPPRYAQVLDRRPCIEELERRLALAATITVNTVTDNDVRDDVLTLREAILISNRTLGIDKLTRPELAQVVGTPSSEDNDLIRFDIPGEGVKTIAVKPELPTVTDSVVIDGYTQPGARANTNFFPQPLNGTLLIELHGAFFDKYESPTGWSTPLYGLRLTAPQTTVRGLSIDHFAKYDLLLEGSHESVIEGNYLGIDATALMFIGSAINGVQVTGSSGVRIGGTQPASRNVIANHFNGTAITLGGNPDQQRPNVIQGNYIGLRPNGTFDEGNATGIRVSERLIIGGPEPYAGNIISGGNGSLVAISLNGGNSLVQGNLIGIGADGRPLGNSGGSIGAYSSGNSIIGNTIAFNATDPNHPHQRGGVFMSDNVGHTGDNAILQNSMFGNKGLGIDLWPLGPNVNDAGDADAGPNDLQNTPNLRAASLAGEELMIRYDVDSDPVHSIYPLRIEFFLADVEGEEGQSYLGYDTYTEEDHLSGEKAIRMSLPLKTTLGSKLVATATARNRSGGFGGTSEFSRAVAMDELRIGPVPKFQLGSDQYVTDEAGLVSITQWASLLETQPAIGELRFAVATDQPLLFAELPRIDTSGTLLYSPQPNQAGRATVTVWLQVWTETPAQARVGESRVFVIEISKPRLFHNVANPSDVDGDQTVSAADVLSIINVINAFGTLSNLKNHHWLPTRFYDVNGDDSVTAGDALTVINRLNALRDVQEDAVRQLLTEDARSVSDAAEANEYELAIDLLATEGTLGRRQRRWA